MAAFSSAAQPPHTTAPRTPYDLHVPLPLSVQVSSMQENKQKWAPTSGNVQTQGVGDGETFLHLWLLVATDTHSLCFSHQFEPCDYLLFCL